jgi:hypothetical protein
LAKMTEDRNRWKAEAKTLPKSIPEEPASAEVGTKNAAQHSSRSRRSRAAGLGVAGAR